MDSLINIHFVINSILFSLIGIGILVVSFYIIEKITPQDLFKEVIINKNVAVAIVAGAFIIAIAMIVSSAVKG